MNCFDLPLSLLAAIAVSYALPYAVQDIKPAHGDEGSTTIGVSDRTDRADRTGAASLHMLDSKLKPAVDPYFRLTTALGIGSGFRFNNPYRLAQPLGSTAESVSLIAPYSNLTVGITFGEPDGFQHGASLRWDAALQGVPQHVITPSYVLLRRVKQVELYGRFGLPLVTTPTFNVGTELGIGAAWFFLAGMGVGGELTGSMYQGAATPEKKTVFYPVLAAQLSFVMELEHL